MPSAYFSCHFFFLFLNVNCPLTSICAVHIILLWVHLLEYGWSIRCHIHFYSFIIFFIGKILYNAFWLWFLPSLNFSQVLPPSYPTLCSFSLFWQIRSKNNEKRSHLKKYDLPKSKSISKRPIRQKFQNEIKSPQEFHWVHFVLVNYSWALGPSLEYVW